MTTDEKIAVAVALVVIAILFMSFLPAFWSQDNEGTLEAAESTPSLDIAR